MFGCSLVQLPSIYYISSAGETQVGYTSERTFDSHSLPALFSRHEKSIHHKTIEDFTNCKRTELLIIILVFELSPVLLDSLCLVCCNFFKRWSSSMRNTWPAHLSCELLSIVLTPTVLALWSTTVSGTLSCHFMYRRFLRQSRWKELTCLTCRLYTVKVVQLHGTL